jgi:hypothetical protein
MSMNSFQTLTLILLFLTARIKAVDFVSDDWIKIPYSDENYVWLDTDPGIDGMNRLKINLSK